VLASATVASGKLRHPHLKVQISISCDFPKYFLWNILIYIALNATTVEDIIFYIF
jgi:hypothetical protein